MGSDEGEGVADVAALLLHPVRLRVLQTTLGRAMTTAGLAELLPEVPTASLYRHVATLIDAGVLEVVDERPVRGAVQRTFRVAVEAATVDAVAAEGMSVEAHRAAVTTFLAGVMRSASDYLDGRDATPGRDGFGYRQVAVWADDEELAALLEAMRAPMREAMARQPAPGRRRRVLTTVVVPDPVQAGAPADHHGPDGD